MFEKHIMTMVWISSLSLILSVGGCGGPATHNGEERGVISDPGPVKADGTNSCKGKCGEKALSGCWCDAVCADFGDCCPDKHSVCDAPAPAKTCADLTCGAGYHCELKGINGGVVPACIKDPIVSKTCQQLGGYCLPLTYPAAQCKADETASTTAGLCDAIPGQSTTCCLPGSQTLLVTEADAGKTLTAQVGSTVEVRLLGNPTTGYQWTQTGGSIGLPLSSSTYTPDPVPPNWAGGGGKYQFFFKVGPAAAGGQHKLQFSYARSWEPQPLQNFEVTIKVP